MTLQETDTIGKRTGTGRIPPRSRRLRLALAAGILAAAGIAWFTISRTHARAGCALEAARNLRSLSRLQARYFAAHGRYAPDPDGVALYRTGATDLRAALPDYRPGPPETLLFDYEIVSFDKGTKFIAVARGKPGTPAAGKRLSIDHATRYPEGAAAAAGRASR